MRPIGRPIRNIIAAVQAIGISIIAFILFRLSPFSLAAVLLIIVWWVDVSMKKMLKYENITMFADLSFSSLIFLGTQGMNWVKIGISSSHNDFMNMVILCISVTLIIWLGNLQLCGSFNHRDSPWLKTIIRIFSFLLGFLSLIIAVFYEPLIHSVIGH